MSGGAAPAGRAWWGALPAGLQDRLVGVILAVPSSMVLALSAWLEPAAGGVGTHKQLGLNGCAVLTATGWPCPMCGMTTTFAHMAHLSPVDAALTQPFGVVLFLLTVAFASVGWSDLVLPAGRWRRLRDLALAREVPLAVAALVGMGLGWAYKAVAMRGEFPW